MAASLGASYVEFDVQLTKDNVPVVYHDFLVAETGVDIPMHELTLEQFLDLNNADKEHIQRGAGNPSRHVNGVELALPKNRRRSVDDSDVSTLRRAWDLHDVDPVSYTHLDVYKRQAGELMIERSRTPETAIDKELFAFKVEKLVDKVKQRTFTLGTVSIGDLLDQMLSMVRSHHVRMESDFVSVVVAILLLEGIGRQLDPNLDLFERFVFYALINGFEE